MFAGKVNSVALVLSHDQYNKALPEFPVPKGIFGNVTPLQLESIKQGHRVNSLLSSSTAARYVDTSDIMKRLAATEPPKNFA